MKRITVIIFSLAVTFTLADRALAQNGRELFQQAVVKERADGDFRGAISLFERIVRDFSSDRSLAANALVQLGECYEKLGSSEAEQAYQRVLSDYSDQGEFVARARARLTALRPAPAAGRGPVARRLLSRDDMIESDFWEMVPSPDGRRVAYVDLTAGGLYLRDLESGEVEALVPGLPVVFNWSPFWSPDGTRIAFHEMGVETRIESMKILDLASRIVTSIPGAEVTNPRSSGMVGRSPVGWFPDGKSLLYVSNDNGELGVVPVTGGAMRVLADSTNWGGSLSPDGLYVAYAKGSQGNEQIFVQAVSGGSRHQVTDAPGGNIDPRWAPDGTVIVYQRPNGLWIQRIVNGDRNGAPRLAYETSDKLHLRTWTEAGGLYFASYSMVDTPLQLQIDPATGAPVGDAEELPFHPNRVGSFAWSPDMQRIAFAVKAEHWDTGFPRPEEGIAVYSADGRRTAMHASVEAAEAIRGVWWSGDGREILYRSTVIGESPRQTIRALDLSTGAFREIFPWSKSRIAYHASADGGHIVFFDRQALPDSSRIGWVVSGRDGTGGNLVVPLMDSDGQSSSVQFSPEGNRLLFTRLKSMVASITGQAGPEAGTVWVVGSDGTGLRKVGAAKWVQSAIWDPSGRFIAYLATLDDDKSVIRILDLTTGAQRDAQLPEYPAARKDVTGWSPDGRFIGIVVSAYSSEYWTIEGLLDAVL